MNFKHGQKVNCTIPSQPNRAIEEMLIKNLDHSVQLFCWECHSHGTPMPHDRVCGNCNGVDTTIYYPENAVFQALAEQKEGIVKMIESKTKKGCTYQDDEGVHENHLFQDDKGFNRAIDEIINALNDKSL